MGLFDRFSKKDNTTNAAPAKTSATKNDNDCVNRNLRGIELEKAGEVDKAIELYEQNVAEGFDGNHPYDRLAIIYHKQKRYEDEERILLAAIDVFSKTDRQDAPGKLAKFQDRLNKLREKNG
jgi:tetratricopeptide (TPR) repeat protein